ncbi:MAG TPA: DUF1549 domain-containing protein [Gemmataceae bacterium]
MPGSPRLFAALAVVILSSFAVRAAEPLHVRIDRFIAAGQKGYEKQVAVQASDAEFLRRVYLDLAGTIPTASEVRAFLADKDAGKREKLIEKLLASPAYARRMAQYYDVVFMERRRDAKVPRAAWEAFLLAAFAKNQPYDALVRDILSADGVDAKNRAAAKFYLDRDFEPNLVTKDIARIFLGRNLQCAQCHDHPLIDAYKQAEYYGILAFLNRSYLFPNAGDAKAVLAEKPDGEVNFVSVFDKAKKQKSTMPRVMTGKSFDEPKLAKGKEYKVVPAKGVRPVPSYSRREKLAAALTGPDNPTFARAGANRLWAMMLGRGIVNPVDLDHTANPASHPELLDLLAKEFTAHKFDVKWLLREIALSKAYQRSSELPAGVSDPPEDRYLVAILKPLSAEQLAFAAAQGLDAGKSAAMAAPASLASGVLPAFRNMFGGQPGKPDTGATTNLDQTLFLKFGASLRNLIVARAGNLTDRMIKAKPSEIAAIADDLFLSIFSRPATVEEKNDVAKLLTAGADRTTAANELVWALLASAEFRFNH